MSEQDYRVEELGLPRESILEEAQRIIYGARNASYGHPRDNFQNIADLWNGYLAKYRTEISQMDVANLVILLKVARLNGTGYHRDSVVDIAGYAGTIERLQEPVEDLTMAEWAERLIPSSLLAGVETDEGEPTDADVEDDYREALPPNEYLEGPPRQWMYLRDDIPEDVVALVNEVGVVYKRDHYGEWRTTEGISCRATGWVSWFTEVIEPRVWQSLGPVPYGFKVTDKDGDEWRFSYSSPDWEWQCWEMGYTTPTRIERKYWDDYAPFTEILGE